MQESDVHPGRLVVIGADECWQLLRTRPVGRVAWSGTEGVSVVPVNFVVDGEDIVLRTTPYSMVARECPDREVAFEVDLFDEENHSGWSVLLRGRCHREQRASEGPTPWVTGPRVLGMRIEVRALTGRRLQPPAG